MRRSSAPSQVATPSGPLGLLWHRLSGSEELNAVPERVRARIRDQDQQSEKLIGWVQLALAATFFVLYAIAPKPTGAAAGMFAPVPHALAIYGAFTVLRLVLAHRGRLPGALLSISIVADTALLLGVIWLFHGQYDQPAAFSLKVPTFVYLFAFIALRALRFDPRYVLMAGISAAVGWIGLTLIAIHFSGPGIITRNFVTYLSGNAILIGAEVDKVVVLLLVTIVLAIGMRRAQRTLVAAVREEAAGREVRRFLSSGVPEAIASADTVVEAGHAVARDAAVVMLDVRGFTRLSMLLPPADVVRVLTSLHARIIPVVERHGGGIDKFLGDGVMVTFGAVHPSPTAAADALRALLEIMDEAARWRAETENLDASLGQTLELNGALAAGPVVFATLGNGERLEYTVIGEAANLAAKLEKHNKTARTRALTTRATFDLAIAQGFASISFEHRRDESIAGVQHPMDLVVLRN